MIFIRPPCLKSIILTALIGVGVSACGTTTYSCGGPEGGHCYAQVSWIGHPTGFSMQLTAVPLTSGPVFIDDEAWLVDYFNLADPNTTKSWVETGEWNPGYGTDYFWAYGWHYGAPEGNFMAYDLGAVSQSDLEHATLIAYKVDQSAAQPSQWNVRIWKAASGELLYDPSPCTSCSMSPNKVIDGQELAGTGSGAEAPLAFFLGNAVINGTKTTYRTDDGTVESDNPPHGNWWFLSSPTQEYGAKGGIFYTDCCAPGTPQP